MITYEIANKLFSYDKYTGEITRRVSIGKTKAGDIVGCADRLGYKRVFCFGKMYLVHRLAWLLSHGEWPENLIDHVDGNPSNNKIENLRLCNYNQNLSNTKLRSDSTTGIKGVYWHTKAQKYCAKITTKGNTTHLGLFEDKELAEFVSIEARKKFHGKFARVF